ncbi:MAG: bifunctional folylpolyglutamate synthase/dihydrofolate synthase [Bacteroidetes bacterium]|nr:bifunctional folylpolyglutamate synthase/dihydrofolate synthase [Bacteroidota bacterium]
MTYAAAEALLLALPRFAVQGVDAFQPGLDRMRRMLAAVGDPHRAVPCLHVAGTNGKGSTASFAAALLTRLGYRTGLHTSPHLWYVGERFRLDGVPAPRAWIADAVGRCIELFDTERPSYFEATTLLAFLYFAEAGATASVIEVGLGGRWDATNVVTPRAALVATVGLDHTDLLGDTLDAIAREKAGIFKPGVPAFALDQTDEALAALRETAEAVGAPFTVVAPALASEHGLTVQTANARYSDLALGLAGAHQRGNAALALAGVEAFVGYAVDEEAVREAFRDVARLSGLRARLETVSESPRIVLDVAHNVDGLAAALAATTPEPGGRRTVLFGTMADKDVDGLIDLLAGSGSDVWPVDLDDTPRALPSSELIARLRAAGFDPPEAVRVPVGVARFRAEAASHDVLLVVGSFLVAAQFPPSKSAFGIASEASAS